MFMTWTLHIVSTLLKRDVNLFIQLLLEAELVYYIGFSTFETQGCRENVIRAVG